MNEENKNKSRSYKDLEVWKLAVGLVKEIYQATSKFPPSESFGLTKQIRRAAVSIPSNIAEGQGRNSPKEFRQFLSFGLGSLEESETQLLKFRTVFGPETLISPGRQAILSRNGLSWHLNCRTAALGCSLV